MTREEALRRGIVRVIPASGPETKGRVIEVAGERIQLPPDAYIDAYVATVNCPQPCGQAPFYVIKRGNSRIAISKPTGFINNEIIAPGEEHAFDFLKEALR